MQGIMRSRMTEFALLLSCRSYMPGVHVAQVVLMGVNQHILVLWPQLSGIFLLSGQIRSSPSAPVEDNAGNRRICKAEAYIPCITGLFIFLI